MHQPHSLSRAQRFSNLKIPDKNPGHSRSSSNSISKTRNNDILPLSCLLDLNTVNYHYHLEQVYSFNQHEKNRSLSTIQNISCDWNYVCTLLGHL